MAALGHKFDIATCAGWFGGDRAEMDRWLHQASEREAEQVVSAKPGAQIAGGEEGVSEELPVILSPGDDPCFEEALR